VPGLVRGWRGHCVRMLGSGLGVARLFPLGTPLAVGLAVVSASLGVGGSLILLLAVISQGNGFLAGPCSILANQIGLVRAGTCLGCRTVLRRAFQIMLFISLASTRVLLARACVQRRLALTFRPEQILAGLVAQGLGTALGMQVGIAMALQVVGFYGHQAHDMITGALGTARLIEAVVDEKHMSALAPLDLELRLQAGVHTARRDQGTIGKIRRGDGTRRVPALQVRHQRLRILPGWLQLGGSIGTFCRRSKQGQRNGTTGEHEPRCMRRTRPALECRHFHRRNPAVSDRSA